MRVRISAALRACCATWPRCRAMVTGCDGSDGSHAPMTVLLTVFLMTVAVRPLCLLA